MAGIAPVRISRRMVDVLHRQRRLSSAGVRLRGIESNTTRLRLLDTETTQVDPNIDSESAKFFSGSGGSFPVAVFERRVQNDEPVGWPVSSRLLGKFGHSTPFKWAFALGAKCVHSGWLPKR
jgi:hypothetical protein